MPMRKDDKGRKTSGGPSSSSTPEAAIYPPNVNPAWSAYNKGEAGPGGVAPGARAQFTFGKGRGKDEWQVTGGP